MGVIDTQKSLTGFANAAHRSEQLLGSCEIAGLRFISIIPKPVDVGDQSIPAAEQSATLGRMFKPGVSLDLRCYGVSDFYQLAHAPDSITVGRGQGAGLNFICWTMRMRKETSNYKSQVTDFKLQIQIISTSQS